MRTFVGLFLVVNLITQSAFAAAGDLSQNMTPVMAASGTNNRGEPFTYKSAYVEGADAFNAAKAAMQAYEGVSGEKRLVISTDDLQNPILETLGSQINKYLDAPKFLFSENIAKPSVRTFKLVHERSKQTFSSMKGDPVGVFVLLFMTAMNTTLYMHFVKHPDFISVGVPAIITFLGNAIYMKSSLLKPLEAPIVKIKEKVEKIKDIAKYNENKVGAGLGINTETEKYKDLQKARMVFFAYGLFTYIFHILTSHGFSFYSPVYMDAILNGASNAPLVATARRWQQSENPPLTEKGIDWLLRSQRFALAFIFPHFYVAQDWVGYMGIFSVGILGWLTFFKGDKIITAFKQNMFLKNSAQAFSAKTDLCNDWLKSLRR